MQKLFFTFNENVYELVFTKNHKGEPLFSAECILDLLGYNQIQKKWMKYRIPTIGIYMDTQSGPMCVSFYSQRQCRHIVIKYESELSQTLLTWMISVEKDENVDGKDMFLYYDFLSC